MSYKITVYFNDEDIASTRIFGANGFVDYEYDYGSSAYSATGFSGTTTFTATPADGCVFTRWVYRVGGATASQQYSYDNPFRYSGDTQELIIRAEGEVESSSEPSWTRYTGAFGTISSFDYVDISLDEFELYRYSVSFAKSGTAYFYTEGTEVDVCGYLSTSGGWDSENGEPSSYIKYDDDGHGVPNFGIQYNVTAGTTYYVWVRGLSGSSSGDVTLCIEPPVDTWTLVTGAFGTISSEASASFTLGTNQMRRYSVSFKNSGSANFFAMGSEDTWGYLSTTTGFDNTNGMPTSYLAEDGTSGPGDNFAITYNVTAGTTYYIWVCESYGESTGTIELYVQPPEKAVVRPSNFSWTYAKVQGGTFNLTATEWNNFTSRINAFRNYWDDAHGTSLSDYSFTRAYSGNNFTAAMYNQARIAIQAMSGYGTYIPTVTKGQQITAYMMNVLVSELNSIP